MNFKSMLDQFSALLLRARHGHKDPFVCLQSLERFHFAVRNRHGVGVIIHGLNPRLLAHCLAGVIEKNTKLVGTDDCVHSAIKPPEQTHRQPDLQPPAFP